MFFTMGLRVLCCYRIPAFVAWVSGTSFTCTMKRTWIFWSTVRSPGQVGLRERALPVICFSLNCDMIVRAFHNLSLCESCLRTNLNRISTMGDFSAIRGFGSPNAAGEAV